MRRFVWVCLAFGLALGGCEAGAQDNALGLCSAVCRCSASALPSQQRACVAECTSDSDLAQLPQSCVECVFANASSCTDLITECVGNGGPCDDDPPVPEPEPLPDFFAPSSLEEVL